MGTGAFAALMAVEGWLVPAISWRLLGFIWIYNLCRRIDRRRAGLLHWQKWFRPLQANRV
jgi:hypothetical protein